MANPQVEVNIGASSVNSQQVPGGLAHIRDLVEAGDLTGSVEKILEFGKHLYPKPEDYEAFNLRVTNLATTFRYAKKRNIFVNLLRILVPSVPSLASVSLVSFYLYQWTGSKLLATSTMAFTSTVGVKLMTELASMGKWMFGFGRYSRKMAEARQGLQAAVKDVLEHDPAYGAIFFSYFSQMAAREGSDLMQLFSEVIESALLERVLTGRDDEGHSRRAILHLAEQSVASGSLVGGIENLQGPLSATMFDLCRKSFSENVASRK
jgi:hypothetical protein